MLTKDRHKSECLLAGLILISNLFVLGFYVYQWRTSDNVYERDFIAFYTATRLPADKLYNLDAQREVQTAILGKPFPNELGVLPFVNPPFIVPVLRVICSDSYVTSYYRWRMFLLFVSLVNTVLLFRVLRGFGWDAIQSLMASFTALVFPAVYSSIVKGQLTALIACGVLLCLLSLQRSAQKRGGTALGTALIKPHIALPMLAPLLRSARYTTLAFLMVGVGLIAVSFAMIGTSGVADLVYVNSLVGNGFSAGQRDMVNLLGLIRRAGVAPEVARWIAWLAYAASLVFCVGWRQDAVKGLGLGILCAVFFAPHVHFHDLYLLVPAMAIAANALREEGVRMVICLLLFAPLSLIYLLVFPLSSTILLALMGVTLLRGLNSRRDLRPIARVSESP